MCFSAKIQANYREYVRRYGADVDVETFQRLYVARAAAADIKIPKALDAALLEAPISDDISSAIADYQRQRTTELLAHIAPKSKFPVRHQLVGRTRAHVFPMLGHAR
ncbi:hypothetical protein [Burkholderia cepacia]|uniref:hypothetical protein n=1 Tax=Burkholderia cepacia TaxID=292 RepID=UPI00075EDA79|nr:hypothetical protein [Burkholderia cepacia]KWC91774.1 hypothetical protein WL56_06495 [Burkholderia cepacia]